MLRKYLLLALIPPSVRCGLSVNNESTLTENLLMGYDVNVRPSLNISAITTVYIDVGFLHIGRLDEREQSLKLIGFVNMAWRDEFISWDENTGIESIRLPTSKIWTPEVVVSNSLEGMELLGRNNPKAMVSRSGAVKWSVGISSKVICRVDVTVFPFDSQKCHLALLNWAGTGSRVELMNSSPEVDFTFRRGQGNSEWTLVANSLTSTVKKTSAFTKQRMVFAYVILQRSSTFYVISSIIPVVCLSVLNPVVFLIPPESGEKMSMSVSILLSYGVYSAMVSSILPTNSKKPCLLSIYLTACIVLSSLVVICAHVVISVHHRTGVCDWSFLPCQTLSSVCPDEPNSVMNFDPDKKETNEGEGEGEGRPRSWKEIAAVLDCIFFKLFFVITVVYTAAILILGAKFSKKY